jgi:EAL and modified HD-GYP domain-containing signal transduction protein
MSQVFINAVPVLDRERKVIGYELTSQVPSAAGANGRADLQASAAVLANLLTDFGTQWLREGKLVFLPVSAQMLGDEDFVALLPAARTVLRLADDLTVDQALLKRCLEIRQQKIGLCLTAQHLRPGNEILCKLASHFELDCRGTDPETLLAQLAECKKYPGKVLVKNIEEGKVFWFCHEMGFDYFQGPFLRRPTRVEGKTVSPSQGNLIELLNLLSQNEDVKKLEAVFKHDPALIVKLLNYVNCAAIGGGNKIKSIGNAISLIGYTQLYRWVALLIYTSDDSAASLAVIRGLLARSRLLELLGKLKYPAEKHEGLFIAGMLSMLDQMFDSPMEKILEKIDVPETIVDALLHRAGLYGTFLALAEACESEAGDTLAQLAAELGLDLDDVARARLEAIAWADALDLPGG